MAKTFVSVDVVAYARPETRLFDYRVPEGDAVQTGQLVELPFGRQRSLGMVHTVTHRTNVPAGMLKAYTRQLDIPPLPNHLLKLADWLKQYYATSSHAVWTTMLPSGLLAKPRRTKPQAAVTTSITTPAKLTADQQAAYSAIQAARTPILLEGVTGSGKTHVYENLIADTLQRGQSVIFLSPEIFLTTQLQSRLAKRFSHCMSVTHSRLTASARRNLWLAALQREEPWLYLGPRSALFLPTRTLGLIIIDEAHDSSYKQEQAPRYQARDVAAELARLTGARLVLGSATPDLFTHWLADHGRLTRVSLSQRYGHAQLPTVKLVDMRGLSGPIAPELMQALQARLSRGEQSLLLHNRRGTARKLSCEACGYIMRCPHCDVGLVFHADTGRLHCHICGRSQFPTARCPDCGSNELRYAGFGTKFLETELKRLLPTARIGRIDRDETSEAALATKLSEAETGQLDILIGTQMIAKGLDLSQVTLVGIVAADDLASGSDFQSRERAVALMMQAAGRAGRATNPGEVYIQTRQPESPLFDEILHHAWPAFAANELMRRRQFGYPPYRYLARITFRRRGQQAAEAAADNWLAERSSQSNLEFLGPASPYISRQGSDYLVQVVVKARRRNELLALAPSLPPDVVFDIDPISVI